jgi:diketogulonate reductase-like aldo/keto reductase
MIHHSGITRRRFMQALAVTGISSVFQTDTALATEPLKNRIPSSGELIPIIGLGSSRTFNVGTNRRLRDNCAEVIKNFLDAGGSIIDSSPMYGTSQEVIGYSLDKLARTDKVFSADKVWISNAKDGPEQMEASRLHWGIPRFDLMQVHNLLSWQEHLETLYAMKDAGNLRYVGITTSHGRRHKDFERIMKTRSLDFVQFSYNIIDREVEQRLLPLALDKGIAVIINRPFQRGHLIHRLERHPLPTWVNEIQVTNWPQFLLKFIVSHPAVTCAIPATSQVVHVKENMGAGIGILPDAKMRKRMIAYVSQL